MKAQRVYDVSELTSRGAHPAKPKIVFVASTSHSGSTLLDLMLSAHPDIVSAGELKQLGRYARSARRLGRKPRCTCGALSIAECPFWAKVDTIVRGHLRRGLGELNTENYSDLAGFGRDNAVLFDAISIAVNKRYIVNSSKHIDRLELLFTNQELDVYPIFLVRDPRGQICSALRKKAKPEENAYGFFRLIGSYVATNRKIHKLILEAPHAVVHYEALAADPQATLTKLMPQLGLAFHPSQLNWATGERHNIGGNRMRFTSTSELKLDERWRRQLTLVQKLAVEVRALFRDAILSSNTSPRALSVA